MDNSRTEHSHRSGAVSVTQSLDRSSFETFAARLLAVWNDHDTTDLPGLVTADIIWIDPALAEPARGPDGVRRFMHDSWRAYPDLHFDVTGPIGFPDHAPIAMVPWRMTGTNLGAIDPPGYAPTGRRIDVQGIDVYTFRGEQLAYYRANYDILHRRPAARSAPSSGSRGEHVMAIAQRAAARVRSLDRQDRHTASG